MTGGGKSAGRTGAALAARNKQIVLDYVDALRRQDRSAIDAALSQNFRYLRLNDRLSRFEYLDALERTVLTTHAPKLDVMFIAADGDSVSVELALEFEFDGRRMKGLYNTMYVIEDGELYEMREYGGIPELSA
jgi:ketosteroid isomerase-like protein